MHAAQRVPNVVPETDHVERGRDDQTEPEAPPHHRADQGPEGADDEQIRPTCIGHTRSQLGHAEGDEGGYDAAYGKSEHNRRPRPARRNAGQHENAGADHRTDADGEGRREAQLTRKVRR